MKTSLRVPVEPNSYLSRLIPCGVTVTYLPSLEVASLSVNNLVSNVPPRKIHVRIPPPLLGTSQSLKHSQITLKWLIVIASSSELPFRTRLAL